MVEVAARERARQRRYDAVVVGAGPNGLAAAIMMAAAQRSVLVIESEETIGGGCRSSNLTLPGFVHDVCSAIHPLGLASPFFRRLDLSALGVEWLEPPIQFAQPFDDGTAVLAHRSVAVTAAELGGDADAYRRLMLPIVERWEVLLDSMLAPLRLPRHPFVSLRFGFHGLRSMQSLTGSLFRLPRAPALLAGAAAHSELPLSAPITAGTGLVLAMLAHAVGWPVPRGGSQVIPRALADHLRFLGGEIITNSPVRALDELPEARDLLFDVTPRQLLSIAGDRFPSSYRRQLEHFRYGPGVFKIDYALAGPIPWRAERVRDAGTVHLGGTLEEIAASEAAVNRGEHPERPFVLLAQQSRIDSSRAPAGKQTGWAYCHVPNGSTVDMTARIERQIERFAPGFSDLILARHISYPADLQRHNANYVGGDINGGLMDFRQLYTRPAIRLNPYSTPVPGMYLCSSSTPPGGGVHGMCGYWAARTALGERIIP